jgi:hypothetical protein
MMDPGMGRSVRAGRATRPSLGAIRETGCGAAAMAVRRLFSGGAMPAPFHREAK